MSNDCEIIRVDNGWLKADWDNGQLVFSHINGTNFQETTLSLNINNSGLVRYDNRLFVITDRGLTEIKLTMFARPILSTGMTWGAMVNETKWFEGFGVQNGMGATFLITPFNDKACKHTRVRELDDLTAVSGKSGKRFIIVVGIDKKGVYHRVEFSMDKGYQAYTVTKEEVDGPEINSVIMPKGVGVTIHNDGGLDIVVPSTGQVKRVPDKKISTDMRLCNWRDRVTYVHNGAVWAVRTK